MRNCFVFLALITLVSFSPNVIAQTAPRKQSTPAAKTTPASTKAATATHVDLSGSWGYSIGVSFSPKGGDKDIGTPADGVPYQPWALAKMKSLKPRAGPNLTTEVRVGADLHAVEGTDPLEECEPNGVPRIHTWPTKTQFIQLPDTVYILYETGPNWRKVRLNAKHPDDVDPSYWGHSIGWYEGKDMFVVDSVGFNDKTWIDDTGRPHTEKLHVIERYRRVDASHLDVTLTIDDPGAYTATWTYGPKTLLARTTEFGGGLWICTIDQNKNFFRDAVQPTISKAPNN